LAGKGLVLVDRELVAVAVDDLPLAVLAAIHLGDPQDVRLDGDAVDRHRGVFWSGQLAVHYAHARLWWRRSGRRDMGVVDLAGGAGVLAPHPDSWEIA
jgi:hypothetical protein